MPEIELTDRAQEGRFGLAPDELAAIEAELGPIPEASDEATRTQEETARFFDVSLPTMRAWIGRGCPVVEAGGQGRSYRLDLRQVTWWRQGLEFLERRAAERKAEQDTQLKLELGLTAARAEDERPLSRAELAAWHQEELTRIKIAQARRELVNASHVVALQGKAFAELRERLRALPDILGRRWGWSDDQVDQVLAAIDDALTDAADAIEALTEDELAA